MFCFVILSMYVVHAENDCVQLKCYIIFFIRVINIEICVKLHFVL